MEEIEHAVGVNADRAAGWRRVGVIAYWVLQNAYRRRRHCFGISIFHGATLGSFSRASRAISGGIVGIFNGDIRAVEMIGC